MIIINSMIRRLFIVFLLFFALIFMPNLTENNFINKQIKSTSNAAFAQNILKINSINFDTSDSIIFLGTSGLSETAPLSVSKGKLSNPERIFFDINNAVLTRPNTSFDLKNSVLKQFKIAQFSTNPNVVRIVITYSSNINPNQIRVLKHNGNLVIKVQNTTLRQEYMTQVYREQKNSPYDYYEKTTVTENNNSSAQASNPENQLFKEIQNAFNENTSQVAAKVGVSPEELVRPPAPTKEYKTKTRYFITRMDPKEGNALIGGVGVINLEKLMYLTEPSRVVFDMPNTIVAQELRGKEFRLSANETIKIGQFEPTIARAVITTPTPYKYKPVYSFDLQSVLIAHDDRMNGIKLFNTVSDISDIQASNSDKTTGNLSIGFSKPIVHSLRRDNSKLELSIYNANRYDIEKFKNKIKNTILESARMDYLPYQGIKITIPIKKTSTIDCYENLNATQLKMTVKTPETTTKPFPAATPVLPQSLSGRIVVIDPGHGGSDTGALRAGIAEKDITLDISKKVASILTKNGLHVELTRWNDTYVSLQERVEFSNSKRTDIFVSVHINSSVKPEVHGIETHYYTPAGYEVARVLHKSIMSKISGTDRGLFKSKFYVINHTEAPSVLLELGFISNDKERNALLTEDRKQKSAEAIAEGIINYLKSHSKK